MIIGPNWQQGIASVKLTVAGKRQSFDALMSQVFATWTDEVSVTVSALELIKGNGAPEGEVEAVEGREYMDRDGVAGAIKYIKRDDDIAGDTTMGWVLI